MPEVSTSVDAPLYTPSLLRTTIFASRPVIKETRAGPTVIKVG